MKFLHTFADTLDAVVHRASTVLLALGGAALAGMVALACANMFMRGALGAPIRGTYELMGFAGALVCAFALAPTQIKKGHIALTMLAGKLPRRLELCIDFLSHLVCSTFFALIAWRTALYAQSLIEFGELSENLHLQFSPFVFAVALGCGMLALALLSDLVRIFAPKEQS